MEAIKSVVRVESIWNSECEEALVEGEVRLPAGSRVLAATARLVPGQAEALTGRVDMDGMVFFTVLYMGEEGPGTEELGLNFTHSTKMDSATPAMKAQLFGLVRQVEWSQKDTMVSVSAVAELCARLCGMRDVPMIHGFSGAPVQTLPQAVEGLVTADEATTHVMLRGGGTLPIRLPQAERILLCRARVGDVSALSGMGQVQASGEVMVDVLYKSSEEGEPLASYVFILPFNETLSVPGAMMGMPAKVDGMVQSAEAIIGMDHSQTQRQIDCEVMLRLRAEAMETIEMQGIRDAFLPGRGLGLTRSHVLMRKPTSSQMLQHSMREPAELPGGHKPMARAMWLNVAPYVVDVDCAQMLEISGVAECTLIYLSDDGTMESFRQDLPFHIESPTTAGQKPARVRVDAHQAEANLRSPSEAEMCFTLIITIDEDDAQTVEWITDAVEGENDAPLLRGIVLYFVQPSDTLWDVARRYGLSPDEVRFLNPSMGEEVKTGQKLVLYRMVKA